MRGLNLVSSLSEVSRLLRETIDTCRSAAQGHGGFLVHKEGLVGAVSRLVERLKYPGGPHVVVAKPEPPIACLDELTSYHLFRIVGEAIVNAHRHSGANRIDVRACHENGSVTLEIEDDGAGYMAQRSSRDGLGHSIMEYRARAIRAELRFIDGARGGLLVRCALHCGCKPMAATASQLWHVSLDS